MPRESRCQSSESGSPLALEKRTTAGVGSPWKCVARQTSAASADAVNVPAHQVPFA
jgi:hypothetical protein